MRFAANFCLIGAIVALVIAILGGFKSAQKALTPTSNPISSALSVAKEQELQTLYTEARLAEAQSKITTASLTSYLSAAEPQYHVGSPNGVLVLVAGQQLALCTPGGQGWLCGLASLHRGILTFNSAPTLRDARQKGQHSP
jgi:hypothetical protein